MNNLNKRGIALITVLAVVVLCLMLLGAFLQTNRHSIQLSRGGRQRDAVETATQSAFEFCRFQLEGDNTWGLPFVANRAYSLGDLDIRELARESDSDREGRVEIIFRDSGATVLVSILNNLTSPALSSENVPANSCRFRMETQLGVSRGGADVVVRKMAFFNSTAVASEQINIDALSSYFDSRDPIHNQIRSQGDINFGSLRNANGDIRFHFRPDSESQNSNPGTIWAKGDISLAGQNGRNSDILGQAALETGATWIDQGRSHSETPELHINDIEEHSGADLNIEAGTYKFTRSPLDYWNGFSWQPAGDVPLLEHWVGEGSSATVKSVYYRHFDMPGAPVDDRRVRLRSHPDAEIESKYLAEDDFVLQEGMRVNLGEKKISIDADRNAKVDGNFAVTSDDWAVIPTLEFASVTDWSKRGSLSAEGKIDIQGSVLGVGNLLAGEDLTISPNFIDQDQEEDAERKPSNIALYAGRDVHIKPPATGIDRVNSNVAFRGLVYADRNFTFQANATRVTGQTLTIEGALVARTGSINIQNAYYAHLIYNPEFLTDLLKQRNDDRGQVELIAWKPR